ncbi:hypothetical protein HCU40_06630 [Pseudanabaena biceps]|nr:hypothetical protein [Pseudanabaena biceps]
MRLLRRLTKKLLFPKTNKKFYRNITFQAAVTFFILSETTIILIVYLSNLNYLDSQKSSFFDRVNSVKLEQELWLKEWISDSQNKAFMISNASDIREKALLISKNRYNELESLKIRKNINKSFDDITKRYSNIDSLLILDSDGKILAFADSQVNKQNKTYENFQDNIKSNNLKSNDVRDKVTNPNFYLSIKNNKPIIVFVNPIFDEMGNRFNILINVRTDQVDNFFVKGISGNIETYLVGNLNNNIFLVFGQPQDLSSKEGIPLSYGIEKALAKERGTGLYKNYNSDEVIGSYAWISNLNIAIVTEIKQDLLFYKVNSYFRKIILIATSIILLVTIIFYVLAKYRIRTILVMTDVALSIAKEGLDVRFPTTYKDEIGSLGIVLNHVLSRFKNLSLQANQLPDITSSEFNESNELLHSYLETTNEGFAFVDHNELVLKMNANFSEIISNSVADSIGISYTKIFPIEIINVIKEIPLYSQEIYQTRFIDIFQKEYFAKISNVFHKITIDDAPTRYLGKTIFLYTSDSSSVNVLETSNTTDDKNIITSREEISQKLNKPITSLLGFLKLTQKKLEENIFPRISSSDPRAKRNIQQIHQNLESMIVEGTQIAKSVAEIIQHKNPHSEVESVRLLSKISKSSITKIIEQVRWESEKVFVSQNSNLIVDNSVANVEVNGDYEGIKYVVHNLINRIAHSNLRTGVIQARIVDGRVTIIIGKLSSLLPKSQILSILQNLNVSPVGSQSKLISRGTGLLKIQKLLHEYGGTISVELIDASRERYKFYIVTLLTVN